MQEIGRPRPTTLKSVADASMTAEIPMMAKALWIRSPAVIPALVAMPTFVPEVDALATLNRVGGPGMKTKPSTIAQQVASVA